MLKRLESHFDGELAAKLSTKRLVRFAQERKKEGAGQYTIDMDISKLGTVYKHMASLLDLRLPHAPSIARPTLEHLQLIGPGRHRDRRPTREEIVKIFEWFAEHPEREQAMPDVIRVAMKSAFRRGELFRLTWSDLDVERRLALVRDRKHPRQKKGNDEWVPLIGDSLEVCCVNHDIRCPLNTRLSEKQRPRWSRIRTSSYFALTRVQLVSTSKWHASTKGSWICVCATFGTKRRARCSRTDGTYRRSLQSQVTKTGAI